MSLRYQRALNNPKDCYQVGEPIGQGSFAKVYLGTHKPTQFKVAIK